MSRSLAEFRAALNGIVNPRGRGRAQAAPMVYHSDDPVAGRQKRSNVPQWVKMGGLSGQKGEGEFLAPEPDYSAYQPVSARQRKAAMRAQAKPLTPARRPARAEIVGDVDDENVENLVEALFAPKPRARARAPRQSPRAAAPAPRAAAPAPRAAAPRGRAAAPAREHLTHKQALIIGQSVGGMKTICPEAVAAGTKVSFVELMQDHITKDEASAVIAELDSKGLAVMHGGIKTTDAQKKKAARILTEMTSFRCPVEGEFDAFLEVATDNPLRSRSRRNPYAGYFG